MDLKSIFVDPEKYNFFLSPAIIRPKDRLDIVPNVTKREMKLWRIGQKRFLQWISNPLSLLPDRIQSDKELKDRIFDQFGHLKGNVLDVGGGWGLFRQWWTRNSGELFIVHDPGYSRYIEGPTPYHFQIFLDAFCKPMTFVEGYGEKLPYRASLFDTTILVEALDHCFCPERVMKEVFRCLKPAGRLVIINHVNIEYELRKKVWMKSKLSKLKKIALLRKNPYAFASKVKEKIVGDHHLRMFTPEGIKNLVTNAGFQVVDEINSTGNYA